MSSVLRSFMCQVYVCISSSYKSLLTIVDSLSFICHSVAYQLIHFSGCQWWNCQRVWCGHRFSNAVGICTDNATTAMLFVHRPWYFQFALLHSTTRFIICLVNRSGKSSCSSVDDIFERVCYKVDDYDRFVQ